MQQKCFYTCVLENSEWLVIYLVVYLAGEFDTETLEISTFQKLAELTNKQIYFIPG